MAPDRESSDGSSASLEFEAHAEAGPDWLERSHPEIILKLSIVEYSERPDRGTIYLPGMDVAERMSTWISADARAWTSLSAKR